MKSIKIYLPNGGTESFTEGVGDVQTIMTNDNAILIQKNDGGTDEYINLPYTLSNSKLEDKKEI